MGDPKTFALIQRWIKEDRSGFLVKLLEDPGTTVGDLIEALNRVEGL
jgi:hypothetical protein